MPKATTFQWGWNDYPLQPDPSMTRQRAARLLWAWRRTSRSLTSMGSRLRTLKRQGRSLYRVTEGNETATLRIVRS